MKQKALKILKYVGISLIGLLLILSISIGVIFQFVLTPEKITPKVVNALNKNLMADLSIDAIELTFFKTFPDFKLELKNGIIRNAKDPLFGLEEDGPSNDTLIQFDYGVVSVNPIAFIGNSIEVNTFSLENPKIYAYVSPQGNANWNILKEDTAKVSISAEKESKPFKAKIDLEEISIINGNLIIDDQYTENFITLQGFDMDLSAVYSVKEIILNLESQSDNLIFRKKGDTYTDELSVTVNTDFHIDRNTKVIDLKNAKIGINDIEFVTTGTLIPDKVNKQIDVDLKLDLEVPTLNTLINLIPETVIEKTDKYNAKGDVSIKAEIKGIYKKGQIPAINGKMMINQGMIAYEEKPNKIELIEADIEAYISPTLETDSYLNINKFKLKGVGTEISLSGKGTNLFKNADLAVEADGFIDMEAMEQTFPFKKEIDLNGTARIHMSATFNVNDLRNNDYGKVEAQGKLDLSDIVYHNRSDSILLKIKKTNLHVEQNQNSTLLTAKASKVTGGKIEIEGLEMTHGSTSTANLDQLDVKFATTPIKDKTQIAVMTSSLLIKNGKLNLGDSLEARIKNVQADLQLKPYEKNKTLPLLTSKFTIDSTGLRMKGRFIAILKGTYDLKSVRTKAKEWPMDGSITFDKFVAYTPSFPLMVKVPKTTIRFEPGIIELSHAKIIIGHSDIEATGKVYEISDAFFNHQTFKGELIVNSQKLDINEMIQALNEGSAEKKKEVDDILKEDQNEAGQTASTQPKSFVVPDKLDLSLKSHFRKVVYKNFEIDNVIGLITIKDQKIDLANLQMTTMAAKMSTSIAYTSREKGEAALVFDFKLSEIDLSKLTVLMPVIDSLLPMANSFEGKVNFRMKGATNIDKNLGMQARSLNAIARVEGDNLVVLNGETFDKIAKMLFFKNKEKNTIDKLEFAMIFKDEKIEIFPSVVTVDRYKVAIGGQHNLDMSFNYHFSILKSPMPFKAGIDVTGTENDMDFKITKAKYKYLFSTKERQQQKADSTLIRRKLDIFKKLPF